MYNAVPHTERYCVHYPASSRCSDLLGGSMVRSIALALILVAPPSILAQQFQNQLTDKVGGYPGGIAFGDFNGDGNGDLVVANYGKGLDATVSVLLGNGDGTFTHFVNYQTAVG